MLGTVARFLEHLELTPIILHEEPDKGRTLIQKLLDHSSDAGFAVVLMTADDLGGPREADPALFQPRARQNVIFELGLFVGSLGPGKVVVLYEEGVEMPSDYRGVLYLPARDPAMWQLRLAKEIKASGIDVDMNKL